MRYAALGQLPPKRHAQFRDDGRLLVEEVMGYEGFSGNESILYHLNSPCRIAEVRKLAPIQREEWTPEAHVHRLTDLQAVEPGGDPLSGRRVLMFNGDLEVSVCKPTDQLAGFYRNGQGDEVSPRLLHVDPLLHSARTACDWPGSAVDVYRPLEGLDSLRRSEELRHRLQNGRGRALLVGALRARDEGNDRRLPHRRSPIRTPEALRGSTAGDPASCVLDDAGAIACEPRR